MGHLRAVFTSTQGERGRCHGQHGSRERNLAAGQNRADAAARGASVKTSAPRLVNALAHRAAVELGVVAIDDRGRWRGEDGRREQYFACVGRAAAAAPVDHVFEELHRRGIGRPSRREASRLLCLALWLLAPFGFLGRPAGRVA
eukprot:5750849-Prymnesium_polylepis.1